MRLYETSFLIAPTLPEEEAEKLIEKMAGIVSEKKGKMINVDNWGKRRLAYPIKKFEDAVYVFFLYKGEIDIPMELERNFKQTESVIRYLTIKMEERDNVRRAKKGAARAVESPPAEREPEEKKIEEDRPIVFTPEEKPKEENPAKETKPEPKTGPKEEKKEEPKDEKKEVKKEVKKEEETEVKNEEVETPAKKKKEPKEKAPVKKGKNVGAEKEAAPKEAAVTEEKEK